MVTEHHENVGVQLVIGIGFLLLVVALARSIYQRRKHFSTSPSVLAVCGTRWCRLSGKPSRARSMLFGFRLCVAAWQIVVFGSFILRKVTSEEPTWAFVLLFYTIWNYLLQTVWWLAATGACLASFHGVGPSARLRHFVHLVLSVCMPASILVTVVLWCVLLPEDISRGKQSRELNFDSYNMHAVNTACLLVECSVNRMLLHRNALPVLLAWQCLYCAFAWAQHAETNFWPYFFMALDTWQAVGWYLAMFCLHLLAYGVVALLSRAKSRRQPALRELLVLEEAGHEGEWVGADLVGEMASSPANSIRDLGESPNGTALLDGSPRRDASPLVDVQATRVIR